MKLRFAALFIALRVVHAGGILVENADQANFENLLLARNPNSILLDQDCCAVQQPMALEFTGNNLNAVTYTSTAALDPYLSFDLTTMDEPMRFAAPVQQNAAIQWSSPDQMMMAGLGSGMDIGNPMPQAVIVFTPNTLPVSNYNLAFVNTATVVLGPYSAAAFDPVDFGFLDAPEPATWLLVLPVLVGVAMRRKLTRSLLTRF